MSSKQAQIRILVAFSAFVCAAVASAQPLTIDLTRPVKPARPSPYEPGETHDPQGQTLTADSRSFLLNGRPWIPVVGEFHYARYPRPEWRDELLKMKAGGINTVSTYVFWIHHEEEQGNFVWSGQRSLRDFLELCQNVGLKVIVRMGPWVHGEARNGGFPDWVQHSGTKLRTTDPAFLQLVAPFFKEEARQMQGLLWKDGGPVVGVQMDNESMDPNYLLMLKGMARDEGIDVPFYTFTGWGIDAVPNAGLLPLFGAYSTGFWGGGLNDYRKFFVFTDIRDNGDMGAQLQNVRSFRNNIFEQFPYACAEIGGGMTSSYQRRIKIAPDDIGAMALVKLGCGNNMPGYYMYQGGTNPEGKLSWLSEDHPNQLPIKDYDFQTALGACGQVREQYHLLREQHLFLQDFGPALARMPAYFPDRKPANLGDFSVLRWDVRSDGQSGFIFFSNHQPTVPLPSHPGVQFALKMANGVQKVPANPVTIPGESYGIWPVNLDCSGVKLLYATVQPLCHIITEPGDAVYFFTALDGIAPELAFGTSHEYHATSVLGDKDDSDNSLVVRDIQAGTTPAVSMVTKDGRRVQFVVLTPEQGLRLWRAPFAGRDRVVLSNATVLEDGGNLRLQASDTNDWALSLFPPVVGLESGGKRLPASQDGVFSHFATAGVAQPPLINVSVSLETAAGPKAATLKGMDETTWSDAAVYKLTIPAAASGHPIILNVHYAGDAARLYVGDTLFEDNFYNGDPMPIALWRIPASQWPSIRIRVLPYSDGLLSRLPDSAKDLLKQAIAGNRLDQITVTAEDSVEARFEPVGRK